MRGYAGIGLYQPKSGENVGGALRAAGVYGAAFVAIMGGRGKVLIEHPTNTMKAHRHIPLFCVDDLMIVTPYDCVPVAVEIVERSYSLPKYTHPERALYIFGPEDGSIPPDVLAQCRDVVSIPTRRCMNLAATVNVVLYDRMAKGE